jgi:L-rhamnose isomerase / sugar isomerase
MTDSQVMAALRGQRIETPLGANAVLMDAYHTDVRPLLRQLREDMGLDPDPVAAYLRSGYAEKIRAERAGGQAAGWDA